MHIICTYKQEVISKKLVDCQQKCLNFWAWLGFDEIKNEKQGTQHHCLAWESRVADVTHCPKTDLCQASSQSSKDATAQGVSGFFRVIFVGRPKPLFGVTPLPLPCVNEQDIINCEET